MRKKILFGLLLFGYLVNAQNYTFTNFTENYVDLVGSTSINNGQIWNDDEFNITLPYSININGLTFNKITVSDSFITGDTTLDNRETVSPYGHDFIDRGSGSGTSQSPLSYKIEGAVGSRITKIEFKNCGSIYDTSLSMFVNFQIWLYETSNIIEFRYGSSNINSSAFYGIFTGGIIGITNLIGSTQTFSNTSFLTGNPANPILSNVETFTYINGTPAANTVYKFTPTFLSTSVFDKSSVTLSPNPVKDRLNFNSSENFNIQSIEIYNMLGQLVLVVPNATSSIDVSRLTSGNYLIKVNTEKGSANTKFIKE